MFRTKHLFIFLTVGALVALAVGIWSVLVNTDSVSPQSTQSNNAVFLSAPQEEYEVVVSNDSVQKAKNAAFIERIRDLIRKEVPTVIESRLQDESVSIEEDSATQKSIESPPQTYEESSMEHAEPPPLAAPTAELYDASTLASPDATTTSAEHSLESQ